MPGDGKTSRAAISASESAIVENRIRSRLSVPCDQQRHGSSASSNPLVNADILDGDARAIVYAEAQRRRVLDVSGLADDDIDVRIRIARPRVVDLQRLWRAVPDRDRAVR